MEISGTGGGNRVETTRSETASPASESTAAVSSTSETTPTSNAPSVAELEESSTPGSGSVEQLSAEPRETISNPEASEAIVGEQSSTADELLGSGETDSVFDGDTSEDGLEVASSDSESGDDTEVGTDSEVDSGSDVSDSDAEIELDEEGVEVGEAEPGSETTSAPSDEALDAISEALSEVAEAAALPNLQAMTTESIPIEGGGQIVTQRFEDDSGTFSGNYRVVTDAEGQVTERIYESSYTFETPLQGGNLGPNGEPGMKETTWTRNVREILQEDGTYLTEGGEVITHREPPDGAGYYSQTSMSVQYGSEEVSFKEARLDPTGEYPVYENSWSGTVANLETPTLGEEGPFRQTVETVQRADGTYQTETFFVDSASGFQTRQTVTLDGEFQPQTRISEVSTPHLSQGPGGFAFLENIGFGNGTNLLERNIMDGPFSSVSNTVTVETFDQDGQPQVQTQVQQQTWSRDDGSAKMVMTDFGSGIPREYELTKVDGENVSTQTFVEGSDDTVVTREYVDEAGFRVVTMESEMFDSAEVLFDNGQDALQVYSGESRMKEEATVADLRELLGPRFEELQEQEPAFAELLDGLEDGSFNLLEVTTAATVLTADGTQEIERIALGIGTTDGIFTFSSGDGGESWERVAGEQGLGTGEAGPGMPNVVGIGGALSGIFNNARNLQKLGSSADDILDVVGDLGGNTAQRRALSAAIPGKLIDGIALASNVWGAVSAAGEGDWRGAFLSGGAAAESVGQLSPSFAAAQATEQLGLRTLGFAGRAVGVAGGAVIAGVGAYDLFVEKDPRGLFTMTTGLGSVGATIGIGSSSATIAAIGYASGIVGLAALAAGLGYDYADSVKIADQRI